MLSNYNYRLNSRRFIQELFQDVGFQKVFLAYISLYLMFLSESASILKLALLVSWEIQTVEETICTFVISDV